MHFGTDARAAALNGSRHLEFLIKNSLIEPSPSSTLDSLYTAGLLNSSRSETRAAGSDPTPEQSKRVSELVRKQTNNGDEDVMLLHGWNGKLIAERYKLPEMEVEIERAVEQVEQSIKKEAAERRQEKEEVQKAETPGKGKL